MEEKTDHTITVHEDVKADPVESGRSIYHVCSPEHLLGLGFAFERAKELYKEEVESSFRKCLYCRYEMHGNKELCGPCQSLRDLHIIVRMSEGYPYSTYYRKTTLVERKELMEIDKKSN